MPTRPRVGMFSERADVCLHTASNPPTVSNYAGNSTLPSNLCSCRLKRYDPAFVVEYRDRILIDRTRDTLERFL